MVDIMTPEQRHRCMAAIRSKDTKPEMMVRKFLHAHGFRYGLHNKKLPGAPDLVFRQLKTVLFIHGCFWHGHDNCRYSRLPKTNEEFWRQKIERNRSRDIEVKEKLEAKGWRVLTVWECDLRDKSRRSATLETLLATLKGLRKNRVTYAPSDPLPLAAEPELGYGKTE